MTQTAVAEVRLEIQQEIETAVTFAKASLFPDGAEAARFTYAE
jgi:TPP-dependent pyruvate/acetoin dehydrogenase alpha subunit